MDLEALDNQN